MFIQPRRLLDQITLLHGPHDLLGRYFLAADAAARDKGVRLRMRIDFEELIRLNEVNRDSWPPLMPIFNPAHSNLRIDSAFWLEGVDSAGDTVITHAVRFFDWPTTTLAEELTSLRVCFEDPAPHIAAGESIEITAPSATKIHGRTIFAGAVWVRPDFRRHGLTKIVPRISRVYAYTRWDTGFTWGFVEPEKHDFGLTRAYGPYRAEPGVTVRLGFRGEWPLHLVWMTTATMLDDVARIDNQATIDRSRSMVTPSTKPSPVERRQGMSRRS